MVWCLYNCTGWWILPPCGLQGRTLGGGQVLVWAAWQEAAHAYQRSEYVFGSFLVPACHDCVFWDTWELYILFILAAAVWRLCVCVCVCVSIWVSVCMFIYTYVCVYIYIYIYMHMQMHTHTLICACACAYVCVCRAKRPPVYCLYAACFDRHLEVVM